MAKPLALTSGEPAGIGPDITIKAWLRRDELKLPAFYLLGDRDFLSNRAKALVLNVKLADVRAEDALGTFADALPVVATGHAAAARIAGGGHRPCGGCAPWSTGQHQCGRSDSLHSSGSRRRHRRTGQRGCHQSDCQERSLPRRIPASRSYRVSRRTRGDRRPYTATCHDAVVPCPRRCARDDPSFAA